MSHMILHAKDRSITKNEASSKSHSLVISKKPARKGEEKTVKRSMREVSYFHNRKKKYILEWV